MCAVGSKPKIGALSLWVAGNPAWKKVHWTDTDHIEKLQEKDSLAHS
jgi:hypothetical protein